MNTTVRIITRNRNTISIINFHQQFEELMTGITEDQSKNPPPDIPKQDSNNDNLNGPNKYKCLFNLY